MFPIAVTILVLFVLLLVQATPLSAGIFALCALALSALYLLLTESLVLVPDKRVAIITRHDSNAVSRLLPTGRHWISPLLEKVDGLLPTGSETVQVTTRTFTSGGLPITLTWSLTFSRNPLRLPPEKQKQLARKLLRQGTALARARATNAVHHVAGTITLEALLAPGGGRRLERTVRQATTAALHELGIDVQGWLIDQLALPEQVQATLEEAHERAVQAAAEARALAELQQVVSRFSHTDMARLAELERLRLLGKQGVQLLMPLGAQMPASPVIAAAPTEPHEDIPFGLYMPDSVHPDYRAN